MSITASPKNNLLKNNPELCKEWDYQKNSLDPKEYTPSSSKKVWWVCKENHSWEASVDSRNRPRTKTSKEIGYKQCPYCSGRYATNKNNLKVLNPNLSKEWDNKKNKFGPSEITPGSNKKAWWICKKNHSWEAVISSRVRGNGCPYCSNNKAGYGNDLQTNYPEIAREWDFEKNEKGPSEFLPSSNKKAWFICKNSHSYFRNIAKKTQRGDGCPYCSGHKIGYGNDLKTNYPDLSKEWDYEKNKLKPHEVPPNTHKKVWWSCKNNHTYIASVAMRTQGTGCPYCSSRLIDENNNFLSRYPRIAKEWDYEKNDKNPEEIFPHNRAKFWWVCKKGHSYQQRVSNKVALGRKCPYCSNQKVGYGNDLKTNHPEVAAEWDYEKNKTKPEEHTRRSGVKVWWICEIGHSYDATIDHRVDEKGCPYCKLTPRSKEEVYLLFELKNFFQIDPNDTKIKLKKIESVDIKIIEINTVVEYDGAYWHKDRALKDKSKTKELERNGWRVIRLREHPLKLINKKFDIKTKPKQYKENANNVLKKLSSQGVEIYNLEKYLNRKSLTNKKEADKFISSLLAKRTKSSVS